MHLKGKLSELEIASNFGASMNIVKRCKSVNLWCQIEQIELSLRAAASRPGADSTPGETRGKRKSESELQNGENVDLNNIESCANDVDMSKQNEIPRHLSDSWSPPSCLASWPVDFELWCNMYKKVEIKRDSETSHLWRDMIWGFKMFKK